MTDSIDGAFGHHGDMFSDDSAEPVWTHSGVDDVLVPLGAAQSTSLGAVHGAPDAKSQEWFLQKGDGYCLPASLTEVLSEVSGVALPDESLVDARLWELGMAPGPDGLPLAAGIPLLQSFGVDAHIETGATLGELAQYLDEGRSIILSVNADEIWYGQNDPIDNPTGGANHALVITAIDTTDGVVVLSDPGNPDGNQATVPLSVFEDAWADGGNQLLVVDSPTGPEQTPSPTSAPAAPGPVVMPMIVNITYVIDVFADPGSTAGTGPYVVAAGDTLWDIAERMYGDGTQYTRIAEANGLSNPDLIHPGERLVIPQ